MCSNKTLFVDPEIWILQHIILSIFRNLLKMFKKKKGIQNRQQTRFGPQVIVCWPQSRFNMNDTEAMAETIDGVY